MSFRNCHATTLLVLVLVLVLDFSACTSTAQSGARETHRQIIFYGGARGVRVAEDVKAFELMINQIKSPSDDRIQAQVKAAEMDGRLFLVADGTRGDVLREIPVPLRGGGTSALSVLSVHIRNGPHANEQVFAWSTATQAAQ